MDKKIENLGLDGHERASPVQFPPIGVEYAVLEKIAHDETRSPPVVRGSLTWGL
jgi:hypothetical protein